MEKSQSTGNCDAHLQEGSEEQLEELQASQPDLGTREDHGAGHPECHCVAYAGQPEDQF